MAPDPASGRELFELGAQFAPKTFIDDEELVIGFNRVRIHALLHKP